MNKDKLVFLTTDLVMAARNQNAEEVAGVLAQVGEGGPAAMYKACSGLAHVVTRIKIHALGEIESLNDEKDPESRFAIMYLGEGRIEDDLDPSDLFALRFLTAIGNEDHAMAESLFDATIDAGFMEHHQAIACLVKLASDHLQNVEII